MQRRLQADRCRAAAEVLPVRGAVHQPARHRLPDRGGGAGPPQQARHHAIGTFPSNHQCQIRGSQTFAADWWYAHHHFCSGIRWKYENQQPHVLRWREN